MDGWWMDGVPMATGSHNNALGWCGEFVKSKNPHGFCSFHCWSFLLAIMKCSIHTRENKESVVHNKDVLSKPKIIGQELYSSPTFQYTDMTPGNKLYKMRKVMLMVWTMLYHGKFNTSYIIFKNVGIFIYIYMKNNSWRKIKNILK